MADIIKIDIEGRAFKGKLKSMLKDVEQTKEIMKIAKKSVKPWQRAINNSFYNHTTRRTGKLGRAMGIAGIKTKDNKTHGAKVRPRAASENNGGWYAHFFARPAFNIRAGRRIKTKVPFSRIYGAQTNKVFNDFKKQVINYINKIK